MAQFNCLVVDDETDIRELVVLTLERMDIRADSASSVAEAKQIGRASCRERVWSDV